MIKNNHKPVILFDVNETLLDMTPIKERINTILDHTDAFRIWFGLLLQYSLVANNTANYRDFPTIAGATLNMVAESFGLSIDDETKKSVLGLMTHLTAYPDVEPGLKKLSAAGFRLATLTNSPERVLTDQLNFAGIQAYFESTLSIDAIKTYKPSLNTYQWAAEQLGAGTGEIILVAAHGWDIAGAGLAGLQTAFISRKGQSLYPLADKPDFIGKDLLEVADEIKAKYAIRGN
ncbi:MULTISPECIES: haloacid dehalogenase type II [unclassified Mucilaginibacter]|uniref:haloacid dehalogenase type II n=1 Tax=unclassified Mucilaginibacter TaxID=2617802 RepID=UPI002AC8E299|nr:MULTISPECIES: haloacid dehalogenase type II [unclassified Mucilaginibacter]MEB0262791.1 haloacid dehalogenase type II [Mucilaginibacter sp. 10I4]MEB0278174.1 haloacid dehalogenase type II [Mucilaginibacter sp. 10B2]MEB0302056.1 haloacid dehalogenase type II [Mucilaginibacter sp. 5C4]WPX23821.1 haloacid dehalogenase type II [Mucilaginibacter sp. 5C4]